MGDQARRVAVVTGGSRGIGRAVTRGLLDSGFRVHFCGRTAQSVDWAVADLRHRYPGRIEGQAVDISRPEEVDDWIDTVMMQSGRIDCLVNNAGVGIFEPVDEISTTQWLTTLGTNLHGAFYCLRAVAPSMREQGSGLIVNIASLAARHPFAGGAAYNASKFGLLGLSDAAMLDLRPAGVKVCAILPGSVATEFHDELTDDTSWMLDPQDVAQTVLDLLRYPDRALPSRIELRPTQSG